MRKKMDRSIALHAREEAHTESRIKPTTSVRENLQLSHSCAQRRHDFSAIVTYSSQAIHSHCFRRLYWPIVRVSLNYFMQENNPKITSNSTKICLY